MSSYVNVTIDELNIGDKVRKLGRLVRDVYEHDTLDGIVVAVFEFRGEENLIMRKSGSRMKVLVESDERDKGSASEWVKLAALLEWGDVILNHDGEPVGVLLGDPYIDKGYSEVEFYIVYDDVEERVRVPVNTKFNVRPWRGSGAV